jgi:phage baseplate assembly protein V
VNAEIKRYIDRLFERQARKTRNVAARGIVSMVDDERKMQENQIRLLDGELVDGAERVQQYGFSSHPQNDAECFVVFAGAGREHPLVFSVDDRRYRIKGSKAGEVIIYTDEGDTIRLKRDNTIEVTTRHFIVKAEEDAIIETKNLRLRGSTRISLETPSLAVGGFGEGEAAAASIKGDLDQEGSHSSTGDQVAGGVSQISHPHSNAGGSGNSGPPIAG